MPNPRFTSPGGSFRHYAPFTPSDTEVFEDASGNAVVGQALFVGTAGNLALLDEGGVTQILPNVQGTLFVTARAVLATGTTAEDISVFW